MNAAIRFITPLAIGIMLGHGVGQMTQKECNVERIAVTPTAIAPIKELDLATADSLSIGSILDSVNESTEEEQTDDATEESGQFVISDAFFEAIRWVESSDGRYCGNQDNGQSHGLYQISAAYLQDANEYLGTNYTLKDVIDDEGIAREVMVGYWNRYLPTTVEPTYEVLAKIHNGGPNGYKRSATEKYWAKVKARMNQIAQG